MSHNFKSIEHQICARIVEWARLNMGRYPFLDLLHHVFNEGKRSPTLARKLGILSGIPDYDLPVKSRGYIGLRLEIKKPGDVPTDAQFAIMKRLNKEGHFATWTDNAQKAIDILDWYCRGYGK